MATNRANFFLKVISVQRIYDATATKKHRRAKHLYIRAKNRIGEVHDFLLPLIKKRFIMENDCILISANIEDSVINVDKISNITQEVTK